MIAAIGAMQVFVPGAKLSQRNRTGACLAKPIIHPVTLDCPGAPMLRLIANNSPAAPDAPPVLRVVLDRVVQGAKVVLGPVDLVLRPRETVALTGSETAAKTALLRVIAGLDPAPQGEVVRPDRITAVFGDPALLPWRTCRGNLTTTLGISALEAENALAEVGLAGRGGDFPEQLSPAQQLQLALARALAPNPQVLLLDDPFATLSAPETETMMTLFERLTASRSVATVIATQNARLAARLAQRMLRLTGGSSAQR